MSIDRKKRYLKTRWLRQEGAIYWPNSFTPRRPLRIITLELARCTNLTLELECAIVLCLREGDKPDSAMNQGQFRAWPQSHKDSVATTTRGPRLTYSSALCTTQECRPHYYRGFNVQKRGGCKPRPLHWKIRNNVIGPCLPFTPSGPQTSRYRP